MATRAFRARPLDVHRPLDIVRDLSLLDSTEGLPCRELPKAPLDAENEKPKMIKQEKGGGKEIPIPGISRVATYQLDYLPTWRDRNTYVRGKGGLGYEDPTLVEYDLDLEDEAWLKEFNGDQERLSESVLELMLWKLDLANASATDRAFAFAGATQAERVSPAACAATEHMLREDALAMLEEQCAARDATRATVYDYWLAKRRRVGRPLLRVLQAPTPPNDNNPYNVFRPRERVNRPQTRRRRENSEDSLDKLRMIRANVMKALDLFELLVKRERKKRDLVYVETDMQQLQVKQRHEPRAGQDQLESDYLAAARAKNPRRPVGLEALPEAAPATTNALLEFKNKKNKKRRKLGEVPLLNAVAALPAPPLPPQPLPPFLLPPDLDGLCLDGQDGGAQGGAAQDGGLAAHVKLPKPAASGIVCARIGRGGRLIFDRCRPFDFEPATPEQNDAGGGARPLHELPNPYSAWAGKPDLGAVLAAHGGQLPGVGDAGGGAAGPSPGSVVRLRVTSPLPAAAAPAAAAEEGGDAAADTPAAGGAKGAAPKQGAAPPKVTPGTASSAARRGPGRPPKTQQKSNLGPGA